MVDEPGGLRAAVQEATRLPDTAAAGLVAPVAAAPRAGAGTHPPGLRPYASTEVLDAEAARLVADRAGVTDPGAVARLATAGRRLPRGTTQPPGWSGWPGGFPYSGCPTPAARPCGVSTRMPGCAGIRPCPPRRPWPTSRRMLMVAAHAWDLRGAQTAGMRTAHVHRPVGDPPTDSDDFDGRSGELG